jgi:26S proteasome regulatory subunit N5
MASDAASATQLVQKVVTIFHDAKDLAAVNEYVSLLAKKRSQLKTVIIDLVRLATTWLDGISRKEQFNLLATLTGVTEGKIFIEVEGARLTKKHAHMLEEDGEVEKAAKLLQEVQVETCGAMERREKAEYILDQMRIVLLRKDFVRAQIVSRKINPKLLEADDFNDIKLQFYQYMVEVYLHDQKYLDISKCYQAMYNTKCIQDEELKWKPMLEQYVLYLLLASYDNEQSDLLHKVRLTDRRNLEKIGWLFALVEQFLTIELITWPLPHANLKDHLVFKDTPHPGGAQRWERLRKRVVQHNLKVVEAYYTRCESKHLASLLQLPPQDMEKELSDFVCEGFLHARIDRPQGVVTFGKKADAEETLNGYAESVSELLKLVENSCHLIAKEEMIHAARAKAKAKAKK